MSSFSRAEAGGASSSPSTSSSSSSSSSSACSLRIVAINDVYELDNLPRYKTAKELKAREEVPSTSQFQPNVCIGTIAGDFLSPSLLAAMDKGCGMIDCLNKCGIDYCCIGNHEGDLEYRQFIHRVNESQFVWINSNIPDLKDIKMPEYEIIEVVSEDGTHKRRVALIGVCCNDMSVFSPNPFLGVEIKDANLTAQKLYKHLIDNEKVDAVIPMTHQLIHLDRELAQMQLFPLILGGHEHEVFLENIGISTIIKTGSDASKFATCDITWSYPSQTSPNPVEVTLEDAMNFPIDAQLETIAKNHKSILDELLSTTLFPIDPADHLSSIDIRVKQTTMGSAICNTIKSELRVECACLVAGSIRAKRHYAGEKNFTYGHLKSELPFETCVMYMDLPGQVICDSIEHSRSFALKSPPVLKGCYLQCDDQVVWDSSTNKVLKINGKPVNRSKMYLCAIEGSLLDGMDNILPLLAYKNSCPPTHLLNSYIKEEHLISVKIIMVSYFCKNLLTNMLKEAGGFKMLDTNGDGFVSKDELVDYLVRTGKKSELSTILINNIFNVVDLDSSGKISKEELLRMEMSTFPLSRSVSETSTNTRQAIRNAIKRLGSEFDDEDLINDVARSIDVDDSGVIDSFEFKQFITNITKKRKVDI